MGFKHGPEPVLFFLRSRNVFCVFCFSLEYDWDLKINPVKIREKEKLEFASILFSVFPCGEETEPEMGEGWQEDKRGSQRTGEKIPNSFTQLLYQVRYLFHLWANLENNDCGSVCCLGFFAFFFFPFNCSLFCFFFCKNKIRTNKLFYLCFIFFLHWDYYRSCS